MYMMLLQDHSVYQYILKPRCLQSMLIYQTTKFVAISRITTKLAHSKYTALAPLKLNIHIIFAIHNFISKPNWQQND